jgi:antitoxin HicB
MIEMKKLARKKTAMNRARIEAEIARRSQMPYTYELRREDDGSWFAQVRELRGCLSAGDTDEEALAMVKDAFASWIESALEDGVEIPEPYDLREYSGRFVIRLPQSLHRDLVVRAEREGVSLNQLILSELSCAHAAARRSLPATVSFLPDSAYLINEVGLGIACTDYAYQGAASTSAAIVNAGGFASIPFNAPSKTASVMLYESAHSTDALATLFTRKPKL